ncbi:MAG TPA: hypothetical protein VFE05_07400 [Longimicrobiaceae bacterium]|jgi:hypothetical protein|nr:hypothetical protein [Longimicrobiaceae bacterium]
MFQIRTEHLRSLEGDDFAVRLAAFLSELFPDAQELPHAELTGSVREQIGRSINYGFVAEEDVASYVVTAWLLGKSFDIDFPAAVQILHSLDVPEVRAARLEEWTKVLFAALEEAN